MSKDVFISYKSEDYAQASWVRDVLETNGISCWIAPDCIPGGSNYALEIPKAIDGCKVFVVVLSEQAQTSKWVPRELDRAINANKVIIPFMLENCELKDDFSFYLSNVQRYAAYEDKANTAKRMILEIRGVLHADEQMQQDIAIPEPKKEKPKKKASADKTSGKKLPKKPLIAAVAVLLAVVIAASAFFILHNHKLFNTDDTYHVTLAVNEETSITAFNDALPVVEERFDAFCGSAKHRFEVVDSRIELFFAKELIGTASPKEAVIKYIISHGTLTLHNPDSYQYYSFDDGDIESVELLDSFPADALGTTEITADHRCLKITLSSTMMLNDIQATPEAMNAIVDEGYNTFAIDDGNNYGTVSFDTYHSSANPFVFYVVDTTADGRFTDCVNEVIQQPLSCAFIALEDLDTTAVWEDTETASDVGELQCNHDTFAENTVLFSYSSLNPDKTLSDGETLDVMSVLRARLDKLGNPYALGKVYKGETLSAIAVKTLPGHINNAVISLLSQEYNGSFIVTCGLRQFGLSFTDIQNSNNELTFTIDTSDGDFAALCEYAQAEQQRVFLTFENYRLLSGTISADNAPNQLTFSAIGYEIDGEYAPLDEAYAFLRDLVPTVLQETRDLPALSFNDDFNSAFDNSSRDLSEEVLFSEGYKVSDEATDAIKAVSKDAEIISRANSVAVYLHMPVGADFATAAPEAAKTVYQTLDFANSPYDTLSVYFIDEDETQTERARVFFTKNYSFYYATDDTHEDGYIYTHGIFTGGRLDLVKEATVANLEADPFYQALTNDLYSSWQTELLF